MMLYGLSLSAIAFKIESDIEYADHLVNTYYETFPKVKDFMEETKEIARCEGELTLFTGRRWECLKGLEYQAVNAIIQGSCAELTALAVTNLNGYFNKQKTGSILSIIHDELLFSLKNEGCIPEITKRMQMENLFGVPFLVDIDFSY